MNTSRLAIFKIAGSPMEITETFIPKLNPGEILIRNLYATLCRSDLNTFDGKRIEKAPTILGHENIGTIEELGPNAWLFDERGLPMSVGDRVTWSIFASDRNSTLGRKGIPQKSPDLFKYGHEMITPESTLHGGLAEYIILRRNTSVIKLSDEISSKFAATINCTVATVAGALRLAGKISGKTIGVIGAGMLGTIACAMCKANGAEKVIVFDIDNNRLSNSKKFGANQSINLRNEYDIIELLPKMDIILEFSGSPDSIEKSFDMLTIGGVVILAGSTFPQRNISINAEKILRNLHSIKGLHNYNNHDFINAVDFVETHYNAFPFNELIEAEFPFERINEAFRYAIDNNPYRVGITFNHSKLYE